MSSPTDHPGTNYIPNQPYNQNSAYQPHTTILEPAEYNNEDGSLQLTHRPFQLNSTTYGNPTLLRAISAVPLAPVAYASNRFRWKYESRHTAQAILPFLHLGPAPVARDAMYLMQNNITMVIAVRSAQSARAQPKWLDPSRFPSCANLQTATFDVDSAFDVIQRIKPILKMMTDHLEARTVNTTASSLHDIGGKILVFCESGNDRSPVLIAAYLMLIYGLLWHESLNLIHGFRFSVALSTNMNEMLKTLEGMFRAEADTAAVFSGIQHQHQTQCGGMGHRGATKRTIDDAYDSDETMTDENEVLARPGVAPFIDTASG